MDEWELYCPEPEVDVDDEAPPEGDQVFAVGAGRARRTLHHALHAYVQERKIHVARRHLHGQAQLHL